MPNIQFRYVYVVSLKIHDTFGKNLFSLVHTDLFSI
jgi:hypothetical protein